METLISDLLNQLPPITLEEMKDIRLMNRTDTKYIMPLEKLPLFLQEAQGNYYAQVIGGKQVNSYHTVYFDTAARDMFIAHQNGRKVREKVRIRTYTDSDISFLEVKHKNNKGRTNKKRMPIDRLNIADHKEADNFLQTHAWHQLPVLNEALENNFRRITLVNKGKTERLTIDYNIRFRNMRTQEKASLEKLVIVELKRDGYAESPVRDILRRLNVKPVSISKYCVGSVLTTPGIKHNRFKIKLMQINKLINTKIYG